MRRSSQNSVPPTPHPLVVPPHSVRVIKIQMTKIWCFRLSEIETYTY